MIISLSPNNPSITTPLEIERSEDFSISSTLEFYCLQSFGVIEQWSIEKCLNSNCSLKQQYEFSSIEMTLSELFIPSKTLEYGIYQMKLTVKMSISPQLISSAMTYVEIIPSSIQVQLIRFGPSIILHEQQKTLILNPGTFSIDPDQNYFNSTVSFTTHVIKSDSRVKLNPIVLIRWILIKWVVIMIRPSDPSTWEIK